MLVSYGIVFTVALVVTYVLTPAVWRLSIRIGAVVKPDERRVHQRPTPTLGGVAMLAGFLAAMAVAYFLPDFRPIFENSSEPLGLVLAALVILAVGVLDDLREVSAPAKVAGQVLAGSVLGLFGVTLFYFRIPFADFIVLSPDLSFLLTVLWVVGMANAVNLIDGLDGLAAGVVAIAAGAMFLYADRLLEVGLLDTGTIAPVAVAITAGLCVGFLPHNFHPAKVFMGDAGALLLGLLMAAATISVGGRTADQFSGQTYFFFAPLVIPFFILGVPFVDTAFAIVRRTVKRVALHEADKEHLHHRLMRLGHGPKRSVLILWTWTAILSAVVLVPTYTNQGNALVPLAVIALAVVLFTLFHPGIRQPQGIDDLDADAAVWPRAAPRAPLAHAEELPPVPQATSGNGANGRAPVRRRNPAP
ncbi:MAG: undecaprenyl/decaprenyl-phosphate alpha-N-acetylglucosaminyl 1-phosphate transferase [Actinomycetota bacterium]|nr:undecaprenyl/decaprenyl-phosphate alpha-N-acetylglucosaminyl 1-phosphate transferase [Actinomycetota bacterium]